MDLTSNGKLDKIAKYGAGIGIGYLAWQSAATAKYPYSSSIGLISQHRFIDALSGIIGAPTANQLSTSIFGAGAYQMQGGPAGTVFSPFKTLNTITFTGAGLLIANSILKDNVSAYRRFPLVPEVVQGAGWGALIGGILGGMFDPSPSGYTAVNPSPVTGQMETGGVATGNVPYARGGSTMTVYNNGSVLA